VGWQVFLASVAFMVGGIIQGLIALNDDTYGFQAWHATLLTIGIMVFAIFFNTFLAVRLPFVEGCILILHLAGFFAVFIPMWVLAYHWTLVNDRTDCTVDRFDRVRLLSSHV
jgi:choline transport protein